MNTQATAAQRQTRGFRPALGILVPCHNEAAVIERKLENLAKLHWPEAERPHRIVVVDDGSDDDTFRVAQRVVARLFGPRPRRFQSGPPIRGSVIRNDLRPGKSAAIGEGLHELGQDVDLLVLTDADVVLEPQALTALVAAFEREPELGMASGAQTFVQDLASDGTCRGADLGAPVPDQAIYDRLTTRVRALESRSGRLFSVHGQLMAWRADLGLVPTPGFAADDLDLMVQARTRGARVELVPEARFLEVRAPAGAERRDQALRRARAYVQFLDHPLFARMTAMGDRASSIQGRIYRLLPLSLPICSLVAVAAALIFALRFGGPVGLALCALACAGFALSGPGRRLLGMMRLIASAERLESEGRLSDRWETARLG